MITNFKLFLESVTPKTDIEDKIDSLMDKGYDNLTPQEKEFLKNPKINHDKLKIEPKKSEEILNYYQAAENFFYKVIGRDVREFDLNDNLTLFDILNNEDEVDSVANTLYYMYNVQLNPEDNEDFKLVNIFKKIDKKIKK